MNTEIVKQLKGVTFIACTGALTYTAMKMTNDVRWIWFMLVALFAL